MKCVINIFDRSFVQRVSDDKAAAIVAPQRVESRTGRFGAPRVETVPSAWEYAPKSAWKAFERSRI